MPQRNNQGAPPVMTWGKALPVLIAAGILDLARAFFEMFWLFGPALAAVACTIGVNNAVGTSISGAAGVLIGGVCTAVAGAAGFFGAGAIETFGVVMSMVVGFFGFLVLGLWIMMTNSRIFKANATGVVWFMGSFAISEIPFIGTLPAFTITLFKLYRTQIKVEKAAFEKYQKEQAALTQRELQLQTLQAQEQRLAQEAEMQHAAEIDAETEAEKARMQAAREARTNAALAEAEIADQSAGREDAANDANDKYIPDDKRLAA